MKLSAHFSLEEMIFSQTAARDNINNTPPPEALLNLTRLCAFLEEVREVVGNPLTITSGYRCLELNRLKGSKDYSQHVKGCAADFRCPWRTPHEIMEAIIGAGLPYDQLIYEFSSWVHISIPNHASDAPRKETLTIDHRGVRQYDT